LLSGASPASKFFYPPYFILQVISYGIPALIMRELAVRWKLGLSGIFILGLGYGIFNEGLLARTFFLETPSFFPEYAYYGGINFAWASFAAIWHSLHAILYPIVLAHLLYPKSSKEQWFSNKTTCILLIVSILESTFLYFGSGNSNISSFIILWLAILIFAAISRKFTNPISEGRPKFSKSAFLLGVVTVPLYLVLIVITKTSLPFLIYLVILVAFIRGVWWLIQKKRLNPLPIFSSFIIGDYAANGLWAVVGRQSMEVILINIIIISGLWYIIKRQFDSTPQLN